MKKLKLYYKGTRVSFSLKRSIPKENRIYLLTEYIGEDSNIGFQLICIQGYKSGTIYAFINKDKYAENNGSRAVTKAHLQKEIIRTLGNFYKSTFKIIAK